MVSKTKPTVHSASSELPHYETAATIPLLSLIATTTHPLPVGLQPMPIRAMQTALSAQRHLDGPICNQAIAEPQQLMAVMAVEQLCMHY